MSKLKPPLPATRPGQAPSPSKPAVAENQPQTELLEQKKKPGCQFCRDFPADLDHLQPTSDVQEVSLIVVKRSEPSPAVDAGIRCQSCGDNSQNRGFSARLPPAGVTSDHRITFGRFSLMCLADLGALQTPPPP